MILSTLPEVHPDDSIVLKRRAKGSSKGETLNANLSLCVYNRFMVSPPPPVGSWVRERLC